MAPMRGGSMIKFVDGGTLRGGDDVISAVGGC